MCANMFHSVPISCHTGGRRQAGAPGAVQAVQLALNVSRMRCDSKLGGRAYISSIVSFFFSAPARSSGFSQFNIIALQTPAVCCGEAAGPPD